MLTRLLIPCIKMLSRTESFSETKRDFNLSRCADQLTRLHLDLAIDWLDGPEFPLFAADGHLRSCTDEISRSDLQLRPGACLDGPEPHEFILALSFLVAFRNGKCADQQHTCYASEDMI